MKELIRQHHRIAALIAALEDVAWRESKLYNSNNPILWLPIAYVLSKDYWLGISKSGFWVVESDFQINLLNEKADMRSLMPCLKKAYYELVDLLERGLEQKKLPLELVHTFPYQTLALFALRSKSDFWCSLALDWLRYIEIGEEVTIELQNVSTATWATQSTRQKASKLLKKLRSLSE
jgi:hypothetical protein